MSSYNNDEDILLLAALCGATVAVKAIAEDLETCKKKKKRIWAREWLLERPNKEAYNDILSELHLTDQKDFRKFLRMNTETFQELINKVGPLITKQTTNLRLPITPEEKLAITLRYLATGETFQSLTYQFRVHRVTIAKFIPEVCKAIYNCLKDEYLKVPSTVEQWETVADKTFDRWHFPNAFAAADGKHIALFHPNGSGSEFYNYKGFYSVVLLALVDYDYKFIYIDVGCQGRISDGGVYNNSTLKEAILNNSFNLPPPKPLPILEEADIIWDNDTAIPFMFVADDAFPLSENIMKPYPQRNLDNVKRIFCSRLSHFRRVSENAFGILACRFGLFLGISNVTPETAVDAVLAALTLHNLLRKKSAESYTPPDFVDEIEEMKNVKEGTWRQDNAQNVMLPLPSSRQYNRYPKNAEAVRSFLADYFYGPGQLPWRWNVLV